MEIIPTAEEFLKQRGCLSNGDGTFDYVSPNDLIEFTKLYVTEALKQASEKAELNYGEDEGQSTSLDINSILNAYPLENMK